MASETRHQSSARLIKRLWGNYMRTYWHRIGAAVLCMAAVAVCVGVQAKLVEPILNEVLNKGSEWLIWAVSLGFLATAVIKGLSNFAQSLLMQSVGLRVVQQMQSQMFNSLLRADLAFMGQEGTGRQIARFTSDVNYLRDAVVKAFTGIGRDILTLAVLIGVSFHLNWRMAIAAFVVLPLAVIPIVKIGRKLRSVASETQSQYGQMTSVLDDSFKGVRQVKAYNMEAHEQARADRAFERMYGLILKAIRVRSLSYPIMESLIGVAVASVLIWGGYQIIWGQTTVGAFVGFVYALIAAYQPMRSLANINASLQEGLAAAQRVFGIIDYRSAIAERPDARPLRVDAGAITFEKVSFSYGADAVALSDVQLDIPAGKTVALVGPSGAGKSTVLNLIPRFYDATAGRVTIDGQDVRDTTLASLRDAIGLVSQETGLFNDSVKANIAYGRPDATEAEIEAAAKAADAHDFIVDLPNGYNTMVGESGLRLSGGQRQRITIARAMLKGAPILLLDEATSSLDSESERAVQTALKRLMTGKTTVVIAHRLSTVMDADLIYVLEQGKVCESGTHATLLAQNGLYAKLCRMQFELDNGQQDPTDTDRIDPLRVRA